MTTDEELTDLRKRYEEREKLVRIEKRKTATIFGILAIIALFALVYAFFQQTAAKRIEMVMQFEKRNAEGLTAEMKKQLLFEMERSAACERSLATMQSSNSKSGK